MLTLIERAAEYASRDIWHSVVQLITNYEELHQYAAQKVGKPCPSAMDWAYRALRLLMTCIRLSHCCACTTCTKLGQCSRGTCRAISASRDSLEAVLL